MKWAIEIERTTLGPRNLSDLLYGVGYQPASIPGFDLVFWSKTLEGYTHAGDVWEEAKRLRHLISDVTEIDPELVLGAVLDLSSGMPQRCCFLEADFLMGISYCSATLTVSPPAGLSAEQLAEWNNLRAEQEYQVKLEAQRAKLEPAFREPRAVKVLKLLKLNMHTGETLYKIFELAEGHPSQRKKFMERFRIVKAEFNRFSDAVHNPVVSGDLARHAYEAEPKTSHPMSFAEAQSFVFDIAHRWLSSLRG